MMTEGNIQRLQTDYVKAKYDSGRQCLTSTYQCIHSQDDEGSPRLNLS